MSDEVSAEDDEQAEQDEDDNGHHSSDHGVVHPRGGRHGCGVLRGGWWDGEEKRKSCSTDKTERERRGECIRKKEQ